MGLIRLRITHPLERSGDPVATKMIATQRMNLKRPLHLYIREPSNLVLRFLRVGRISLDVMLPLATHSGRTPLRRRSLL
jgi:hypothetical protein